ncbi:unnamed protein product [Linum tenue]|uniref:Uncharacterized protein n=1 Tax=Linum tenue TaxID=586396 RepID=A0AAV0L8E8_9ROSI|nr:unnamed protein product [Linum tenue]CAI0429614.1 unnamed protein product [Linum tenue]
MAAKFQKRSVSLPARSHPATIKIHEELTKLGELEQSSAATSSSSSAICSSLSTIRDVYDTLDELLAMASTQEALSRRRCVAEEERFLDGSVKLMDTCEIAKDVISRLRENVAALQSAIRRRRKGDSVLESSVSDYIQLRRKTRKDARKLVAQLKQQMGNHNYKLPAADQGDVIRVMREVNAASSCVLQALLSFVATPVFRREKKQSKWGIASKLVMTRKVAAVGCEVNEIQAADVALLVGEGEKKQFGTNELESVERCFKEIEDGLEGVFRRLIKSRASLLNILSQ